MSAPSGPPAGRLPLRGASPSDGRSSRCARLGALGARSGLLARSARSAAGRRGSPSTALAVDCRVSGRSAALVTTRVNSTRGELSEVREIPLLEQSDLYLRVVLGLGDLERGRELGRANVRAPSPGGTGLFTVLPALERHLGGGSYRFPSGVPVGPLAVGAGRTP